MCYSRLSERQVWAGGRCHIADIFFVSAYTSTTAVDDTPTTAVAQPVDDTPSRSEIQGQSLQIAIASNVPALLWGQPGEGKSATIENMTLPQGIHLEVIIGSQHDPTDIAGQPWVVTPDSSSAEGPHMIHLLPDWAYRVDKLPNGSPSVVFFDELDKCPPAVQNACLRAIRERAVGDIHLSKECRMLAAANYPGPMGGFDLTAPMSNRLMHLDWAMDPDAVLVGLGTDIWPNLPPIWPGAEALKMVAPSWRGRIVTFLHAHPQLVRVVPETPEAQGRPWPSPRSWGMALDLCTTGSAIQAHRAVLREMVVGVVGVEVGEAFMAWADRMPLMNAQIALQDPTQLPYDAEPELLGYMAATVAVAVAQDPTQQGVNAMLEVASRINRTPAAPLLAPTLKIINAIKRQYPLLQVG